MICIRWMLTKDLDTVTSIETKSNEYYISRDDMIKLLRKRSVVAMVAVEGENEDTGEITGFMIYELMNRRIQLLDIAVHTKYRRKGIGTGLIEKLKEKLSHKRRTKISTEVRESNLELLLFLKRQNFRAVEVIRNYFQDTGEDAFVMHFVLPTEGK